MTEPTIIVRDGHKRECKSNLRITFTQSGTPGCVPNPGLQGKPVYIPIPPCDCGAEAAPSPNLDQVAREITKKSRTYANEIPVEVVKEILLHYKPTAPTPDLSLEQELREIRERLNGTTEGPWYVLTVMDKSFVAAKHAEDHPYFKKTRNMDVGGAEEYPRREADLNFIAHAHQDIPRLLSIIEGLRGKG